MKTEKILPETLLQLMLNVFEVAPDFVYKNGIQPFLMELEGREFYVYVKNLSSAYFKSRPDTTRAQLPVREEFETRVRDKDCVKNRVKRAKIVRFILC